MKVLCVMSVAMAIALPLRIYLFRRHHRSLKTTFANTENSILSLPLYEFYSDVSLWTVNVAIVLSYLGYIAVCQQLNFLDALKYGFAVFFGFMATGLILGMISFLEMEKELVELLIREPISITREPKLSSSMFKKFNLLLISIFVIFSVTVAYVLFNNLVALTEKNSPSTLTDIYYLFSKMLAINLVLLGSGVSIINRIARNTKLLFNLQLNVLQKVQRGDYTSRIPIVSSDEFSIIANQTNQMIEGLKEREFIRDTFGRYVTQEVRDLILSQKIPLDGEVRIVTILFCDIRNFSTYSESRHPQEVIKKINEYFAEMTEVIHNNGGIVIEYLGDGIEAVFGAPSPVHNHSELAIKSALEMRNKLLSLNQHWERKKDTPLRHGIGIHTGEVVAGNVGPPSRISYKMIGDTVNLAARIQELTKTFDSDVLISKETYLSVNNQFNTHHFGTVNVRGKKIETDIYGVL